MDIYMDQASFLPVVRVNVDDIHSIPLPFRQVVFRNNLEQVILKRFDAILAMASFEFINPRIDDIRAPANTQFDVVHGAQRTTSAIKYSMLAQ